MSVCCRSQDSACVCVCVCVSLSLSLVRLAMAEFIENLQTKAPWEGRWWASSSKGIATHASTRETASERASCRRRGKGAWLMGGNDDGPIAAHLFTGEGSLYVHTTGKFLGFFFFSFFPNFVMYQPNWRSITTRF
jgi:hypothetical protein